MDGKGSEWIGRDGSGADRTGEATGEDRIGNDVSGVEGNGVERRNGLRPVAQVWRPGPDEQPTRKDRKCTRKSMPSN